MTIVLASSSEDYGHCCPPVFNPYTLAALLGGVALATNFLRLVIITDPDLAPVINMAGGGRTGYFGKFLENIYTSEFMF